MEQQKKIYTFYRSFPDNLILELYKENHWSDIIPEVSEDQKAGLIYVLSTLTEWEEFVIRERYEVHKTLKTIAEETDKVKSYIQSFIARAKKKLRKPERSEYIINGYQYMMQKEKIAAEEAKKKTEALIAESEKKLNITNLGSISISRIGLSTRVMHILERNSITTFYDLVYLMVKGYEDALNFHHFGVLSLQEVVEKLGEYGIDIEAPDFVYETQR